MGNMLAEQEAGSQGHVEISGISLQSLIFWAAFILKFQVGKCIIRLHLQFLFREIKATIW